ncbi:MAG: integrase DNA-binding domain-containing protein [Ruminococcus bicirculans (ex Wegman et al. 2014)]|uniref:integrase DNA-binding domain-containing protein n=1 Tax=Ruminococcus bicirculans (ex Wegman et al. 2014) TaxID=1160721 RepID=UPI0039A3EA16
MLKKGESERAGGGYDYRWTQNGERRVIYAPTLQELREKKKRKSLPMFSEA